MFPTHLGVNTEFQKNEVFWRRRRRKGEGKRGKEGKATETKLERGRKLIRELLADKKEISIRELDEKAKEQGISGRTMRDVRSRMKNELEYQVNEKQENSIRLKE